MKHSLLFTLLVAGAACASAASPAASGLSHSGRSADEIVFRKGLLPASSPVKMVKALPAAEESNGSKMLRRAVRRMESASQEGAIWRPGKMLEEYFEEEWLEATSSDYTYDLQGRVLSEMQYDFENECYYLVTAEYDDATCTTTYILSEGETPDEMAETEKTVKMVDSRMPALTTAYLSYVWDDASGDWMLAFPSYKRIVERDDKGNVTASRYYSYYTAGGDLEEVQRILITYNENGEASTITEYMLSYDENEQLFWDEAYSLRDCEWYNTDGQIWDLDSVFEGGNRIKSYSQYRRGEIQAVMEVEYVGDTDDFTCVALYDDNSMSVQEWENYEYGGYNNYVAFLETPDAEADYEVIEHEEYDFLGNLTLGYAIEGEMGEYFVYGWEETVTELNADGLPAICTHRTFIPEEEEWEEDWMPAAAKGKRENPAKRAVSFTEPPCPGQWVDVYRNKYTDYIDCASQSGVCTPVTDAADAEAVYYTLDGRRVKSPEGAGVVIRRRGAVAEKVIIR